MIHCIVVDDERMSSLALEQLLSRLKTWKMVGSCTTVAEAHNLLAIHKIDVIFLDVELPDMSGLEFLSTMKEPPEIVLISSQEKYALRAFEHDVADYLLKPVTPSRFMKTIMRLEERLNSWPEAAADVDGMFVRNNNQMSTYHIFELQPDLAHPSYELYLKYIHPDDRAHVEAVTRKSQDEFVPFSLTHRIITKNGIEKIVFSAGNFEFDKRGTAVTLYGVLMDVTTLKTSEQKLMDYHIRHELVSKATNDAIWDWDIIRNTIQWNHGIESIFGYKIRQQETTEEWWKSRIHPDDYIEINNLIQKGFDTHQSNLSFQYRYRCANQAYKHVLDRAHIVYKDGKPVRMIGAMQDVTEIVQYREGLEKMVEERTAKLNEALAKEKELVDLKSKFVSIASHEFKTPLTTISLATGFIRKHFGKLNLDDVEKKLQSIEKQVNQMTFLLNDILTIGKSDAGKMQANLTELDPAIFRKLADEAVHSRGKSHQLIFEQTCKFRQILTDEKLIRNIVINLVTNAVKFSPDATTVEMTVKCTHDRLHVVVTDHGIGIPKEDQKNLFVSFSRGSNAESIEGTGLGLSIVKKAVDMLQGSIEIVSEVGKGTTAHVTLPI